MTRLHSLSLSLFLAIFLYLSLSLNLSLSISFILFLSPYISRSHSLSLSYHLKQGSRLDTNYLGFRAQGFKMRDDKGLVFRDEGKRFSGQEGGGPSRFRVRQFMIQGLECRDELRGFSVLGRGVGSVFMIQDLGLVSL